jgi:hypothetical protein
MTILLSGIAVLVCEYRLDQPPLEFLTDQFIPSFVDRHVSFFGPLDAYPPMIIISPFNIFTLVCIALADHSTPADNRVQFVPEVVDFHVSFLRLLPLKSEPPIITILPSFRGNADRPYRDDQPELAFINLHVVP